MRASRLAQHVDPKRRARFAPRHLAKEAKQMERRVQKEVLDLVA
jgi:hypothetical protein